jgi:alpha-tubulin suppressor-like RCC1 family protein
VQGVEEIVVGGHFALCRTSTGEVYGAGHNGNGKLGLGDAAQRTSWTKVNIGGIKKIYAWDYGDTGVSALITNTDELLMAGYNGYGGLGMGDTTARNAFVRPNAAFQGKVVKVLGSGWSYPICVVLDSDGNLWGAGCNAYGQLARGDNTRAGTNNTFQKLRHGLNNGVKIIDAVALGFSNGQHILALTNDGRLLACGYNGQGQLGINATIVNGCEDILRVARI